MKQLPPGTPADIQPAPIDNKHAVAVKKTYELLDEESQNYFNNLFNGGVVEASDEALWVIQNNGPFTDNNYEGLNFTSPQNQIEWQSTTSLSVSRYAQSIIAPQEDDHIMDSMSSSSDEEVNGVEEQPSDDDYDAPIVMQPTSREWISKQFRLTQGELERKNRRKNQPNYAKINDGTLSKQ